MSSGFARTRTWSRRTSACSSAECTTFIEILNLPLKIHTWCQNFQKYVGHSSQEEKIEEEQELLFFSLFIYLIKK